MESKEMMVAAGSACALLALLIPLVFMQWGVLDLNKKQAELNSLRAENESVRKSNGEAGREVRRLKGDPGYLEYVARRELGMVAEDEVVVKFHEREGK